MPVFLLLMLAAPPDSGLSAYRDLTRATPHCTQPSDDEVTVCGRRAADRYRVPLIEPNPEVDAVPLERERLLARTNNCQEKRLFLTGCGMVGVTASTARGLYGGSERPIAP